MDAHRYAASCTPSTTFANGRGSVVSCFEPVDSPEFARWVAWAYAGGYYPAYPALPSPPAGLADPALSLSEAKVLTAYAKLEGRRGYRPSRYEVAQEAGVSESTAQRSLTRLRALGLVPHPPRSGNSP
jgi:hypothetical protein